MKNPTAFGMMHDDSTVSDHLLFCTDFRNQHAVLPGDINRDGFVNLLDVEPFVMLLSTGEFQDEADINQDGEVNLLDVDPFVLLLSRSGR